MPPRILATSGGYPFEELVLLADAIIEKSKGEPRDTHVFIRGLEVYVHDYCYRAGLTFDTNQKTDAGELHTLLFVRHLTLRQLEAILPRFIFDKFKTHILNDFKIHEPYLDRVSVQKYLQPEVANMLIFGTTFFDRDRVGSKILATPSEAQVKDFCKEFMPSDDYEQIVENKLYPPSPVDLMRALKPEAIVELFERNGVWSNYTDAQIEKMLPEGIAMIDILDARDGA